MSSRSAQNYAAAAGVLLLISVAAGGFGEAYVPAKLIVSNDANATAANVHSLEVLFRLGFAAYLIEALCDTALFLIFYVLLRPVSQPLALLAAFLGIISTTLFAVSEMFYFAPALILKDAAYLKTFSQEQLNTFALLSLKFYALTVGIFMAFYGASWIVRGYLIMRSGYLPSVLGLLLLVGGAVFGSRSFLLVLAPDFPSGQLPLAIAPGVILLALWLLLRGVNTVKWDAQTKDVV